MYSNFPGLATRYGLDKLTIHYAGWEKQGNFLSGEIRYKDMKHHEEEAVNFRLLEEDLDEYGFPKLQITWDDETKVYNLSEDHSAKTGIDFIQFEYEWNLVEAFGLAVLHTNNEITALTASDASENRPVSGNA